MGKAVKCFCDRQVYCNHLRKSIVRLRLSPRLGLKLEPSVLLALLSAERDS